jgi:hypothetical protein
MGIELPHGTHGTMIINLDQIVTVRPDDRDKTHTIIYLAPAPAHANIIALPYSDVIAKLKSVGWLK